MYIQKKKKNGKDLLPRIHRRSSLVSGSLPLHLRHVWLFFFGLAPLLKPICTLIWLLFIKLCFRSDFQGNFLAIQWLGLRAPTTEGLGSIPGQGTKIPQGMQCVLRHKTTSQDKVTFKWQFLIPGFHRYVTSMTRGSTQREWIVFL